MAWMPRNPRRAADGRCGSVRGKGGSGHRQQAATIWSCSLADAKFQDLHVGWRDLVPLFHMQGVKDASDIVDGGTRREQAGNGEVKYFWLSFASPR